MYMKPGFVHGTWLFTWHLATCAQPGYAHETWLRTWSLDM